MKICQKCKELKDEILFNRSGSSKDGRCYICKKCNETRNQKYYRETIEARHLHAKKYSEEHKAYFREYSKTLKRKYSSYKRMAKVANRTFALTLEEFTTFFWQKPCSYCGTNIETVGIDRVNNTKGYIFDNCVPCCEPCNRAKLKMTLEEFLDWIVRVYSHSISMKKNQDEICSSSSVV